VKQSGKSDDEGGIAAQGLSEQIEPVKGWANTDFRDIEIPRPVGLWPS
jgi:hypothetical protein